MSRYVIGKYRLVVGLGHGGMADVFLAVSSGPAGLGFSKLIVIKRLREHLANDPDFVAMLIDEARIAARLNHPNVIQTIEIGEEDGGYFLAMEYLDGQPLRSVIERASEQGGVPPELHYNVLVNVLAGLHHAHELVDYDGSRLDVVHRDVTPHNVFVTYNGQVKVVDFGIAKAAGRASETRHGVVKGKAAYMAPEQARGAVVGRQADLFSVGVMLWEAAVGRRLWADAKDDSQIIRRLTQGKIPFSPRAVKPDVPEAIDAICRRALAFKAEDRYATAAEFEAELVKYLEESDTRTTDRDLATFVGELFADTRERTKAVIESELAQMSASAPSSGMIVQVAGGRDEEVGLLRLSPQSAGPTVAVKLGHVGERRFDPSAETQVGTNLAVKAPPARDKRFLSQLALAAVVVGIGVSVLVWRALSAPRGNAATDAPRTETILVTLRANPAETQFFIDDGAPVENPYVGNHTRDSHPHRIRAEAPGYRGVTQTLMFDNNVSLRLALARDVGQDGGR